MALYPIRKIYNRILSADKEFVTYIRSVTGETPKRIKIYKQAFRHRSAFPDTKQNNERLELLGDSIIDMLVAEYIYRKYPYEEEGFITELRSKIVNRTTLNEVGNRLGLVHWIEYNKRAMSGPPKDIEGNTFEALIGAMYLDAGFDRVRRYFFKNVLKHLVDVEGLQETEMDFKSKIYHYVQREGKYVDFKVISEERKNRKSQFVISLEIDGQPIAQGVGSNKKVAEQLAAKTACAILQLGAD